MSKRASEIDSDNKNLVACLKDIGCIIEGEIKLKNGEISNIYYDIKSIISHPILFEQICHKVINLLPKKYINYKLVMGIPYGGLPIASYISITNNNS